MQKPIFLEYSKEEKEQLIELCSLGCSMGLKGSELLFRLMGELLKVEHGMMLTSNQNDIDMLINSAEHKVIAQLVEIRRGDYGPQ